MFKINENYLKLPGSYLFSTIGKKVAAYQEKNPDRKIIRLGIGDVRVIGCSSSGASPPGRLRSNYPTIHQYPHS